MIKKIAIDGLLSFEGFELELRDLNVLIGPNGSGKSNLIGVLSLLQALPRGRLGDSLNQGGGIGAWIGKADVSRLGGRLRVGLETERDAPRDEPDVIAPATWNTDYAIELRGEAGRYSVSDECIRSWTKDTADGGELAFQWRLTEPSRQSVLGPGAMGGAGSGMVDEVAALASCFDGFRLYQNWGFGAAALPREFQPADQPVEFLEEDLTNLALVLQNTFISSGAEKSLNEEFGRFFQRFERFSVSIFGNQVLLNMHEEGLAEPIPATRWSDGMIRYLSLLAILLHPSPPPLICIDEPELGFHPDILPHLGRLIKEASERTQIVITTHSKDLVDCFADDPGAVVVCERGLDGETTVQRLDADRLEKWLEDYTLGDLWASGEIGGNPY